MDTYVTRTGRPLFVDLDGTLIRGDLLWESLFHFARQEPLGFWRLFGWAFQGKAVLKDELAARTTIDAATLPYREEVVATLQAERETGRPIVLATASNERLAHAVSDHLGLFDEVMASDREVNLSAQRKLERIRDRCGAEGFDYFGNSHDDVCLFEAAETATVVQPDRSARRWHGGAARPARLIVDGDSSLRAVVKSMRPHQWSKNVLVFVPMVLNHEFLDFPMFRNAVLAFLCFSLAASSVYILNDLLDLEADRRHRTKRKRPFASGQVPIPTGLCLAAGLFVSAFAIAAFLPWEFMATLAVYMVATTAYSFALKRMLLIDVLTLAGLYTLRIIAGAMAIQSSESFWLLAFSIFFFLSLALVKRFVEIMDFGGGANRSSTGRGYVDVDLDTVGQAGMASGFASVMVLALYIDSGEVRELYAHPYFLWPLCPLVLYIIVRIWVLARRSQMNEDPVVFIMHDWRSQIMMVLGACMFLVAAYV
ncbi:UbiA family prenyltransferase [Aureimonas flava]|uniref:UbiA family prenyltransferase n=1 Tax=Aureimonas flava TaxID=2320271 RepID=A0A3A1WMU8_9HYPH|nr:UbiA family prenyltransferase [Aureimonas flava]RIY01845.1 UbiA family prenyltransferase [Aureimonas flava]